jgi:hypothetical protein
LRHVYKVIHTLVQDGQQQTIAIPVARTPVRIEIAIPNTIPPTPGGDPRHLGAQVSFTFVPAKPG